MADSGVERTLGILLAKVEGIERSIQNADRTSDAHRATVHRRIDELVGEVGDLRGDVSAMKSDVADTKSVTDDVRRWKLMGMGALAVTGVAAGAIASAVTYFWPDIVRAIRGM